MYTYIKNDVIGNYLESYILIDTIPGYEGTVGTEWKDYNDGMFLLLSDRQLQFRADNPAASIKEVWDMYVPEPEVIPEPERTLDDAKAELHRELDEYADSLRAFYVNGERVWFNDRPSMKLQVDPEAAFNNDSITFYIDKESYRLGVNQANSTILSVEDYNTQINDFIAELHTQIDTIPSLEFADSIVITDFTGNAPSAPSFTLTPEGDTPSEQTYAYSFTSKLNNCYASDAPQGFNSGDAFVTTVYPEVGHSLYREDIVCEMGAFVAGNITFEDDLMGRPEYASAAHISIDSVNGDVFIAGNAHIDQQYDTKGASLESLDGEYRSTHNIIFKMVECYSEVIDTSISKGSHYMTRILPNPGYVINRSDTICEMDGVPVDIRFKDDQCGRDEFAYAIDIDIPAVTGDLFISAVAYIGNHE